MKAEHFTFVLLIGLLSMVTLAGFASSSGSQSTIAERNAAKPGSVGVVSTRTPSGSGPLNASVEVRNVADTLTVNEVSMEDLIELAEEVLDNLRSNVRDYSATLIRQERIHGKLGTEVKMEIKIRNPSPNDNGSEGANPSGFAAYLKFLEPRSARGREVIWKENENENRLIAHEGGFKNLLRLELAPDSSLAMLGNKYPISEIGLIRLVEQLLEKCRREVDLSRCRIEVFENQEIGDRQCRLIQVSQPKSAPGADFYIAQVFIDMQRKIPLRYAAFMWPEHEGETPPLEEVYTYLDLQLNVGFADADFDPDNPAYNFP